MADMNGFLVSNGTLQQGKISKELLSRKPRKPAADECCGSGCILCVNDIYEQELAIWELECMRELQFGPNYRESQQGPAIRPDCYKSFTLQAIKKITGCCSRYVFAVGDVGCLGLAVGQHLIMRASVDGEMVTRQYTPISSPSSIGFFEVMIKVYPQGKMSKYIRTLQEGSSVEWRGPFGGLDYKPNMHKHLLLLAAGTGITPMIQVLHHITSMADDYTMVRLLFGVACYNEIYLKKELDELKRFWNISVVYCLGKETNVEDLKYGDEVHYGAIDEDLLEVEFSKCHTPPHVLICGPNSFNNRFVDHLKKKAGALTWHVF